MGGGRCAADAQRSRPAVNPHCTSGIKEQEHHNCEPSYTAQTGCKKE